MNNENWNDIFPTVPQSFHEAVQRGLADGAADNGARHGTVKRKFPVVLAAVVAALCVTAAAAYVFQWNDRFASRFDVSEQQKSELQANGAVADINQTASGNGVTITAVQTLGDKNGVYILLDIKLPENVQYTEEVSVGGPYIKIGDDDEISWTLMNFGDPRFDPNISPVVNSHERLYELYLDNFGHEDWNGKPITLDFRNVYDNGSDDCKDPRNSKPFLTGKWELSWTLSYSDQMQTIDLNKPYTVSGKEFLVKRVEISPFSMKLTLGGSGLAQLIDDSDMREAGGLCSITLVKKDGTTFFATTRSEGDPGDGYRQYCTFESIQDLDQITGFILKFYNKQGENTVMVPLT